MGDAGAARAARRASPGFPIYSVGAVLPAHARSGGGCWGARAPAADERARSRGARELNGARERVGLRAARRTCTAGSRASWRWWRPSPSSSTRAAPAGPGCSVTGPLLWEQPFGDVELPPGDDAARAGGAEHLAGPGAAAAARGARGARGRARAGAGHAQPPPAHARRSTVPANARLVDWVSYARTMPLCDAVVCHAGHGTLARALASGAPVVACPPRRRHGRERGPHALGRASGVSLPRRFHDPARRAAGGAPRCSASPSYRRRADELRDWATRHDGAARRPPTRSRSSPRSHKNSQRAG